MSSVSDRGDRRKVDFRLTKDEDGYPPSDWEGLWAEPAGAGRWRLDNIPFYVYDVSNRDVIAAEEADGRLEFRKVLERGGHSTFRIIFEDLATVKRVRDELRAMGCSTEGSNIKRLVSVDVKSGVSVDAVRAYLEAEGERSGLGFEDACIQSGDASTGP